MAIFRLIPAGDLALENGSFVWITGADSIKQQIASRFKFFKREWFLDLREGLPYYEEILVRNPDLDVIRRLFRDTLLSTPGVLSITEFEIDFTSATRTLAFRFKCVVDDGVIEVTPDDELFILDL